MASRPRPWVVTDELWSRIEPLLPMHPRIPGRPGRPWLDDRQVLCGILFVLHTGIQWEFLPRELGYGSGMTCWRRLRDWNAAGIWNRLHQVLLAELHAAGKLDWDHAVVDSSHIRAMKGGDKTGPSPVDRARCGSKHQLLAARDGGFCWVAVAGRVLTGWIVVDIDATLITAHSDKDGAAATFKKGWGFHPLGAWCANTGEALSMLLRPGNAGANTVTDHLVVLEQAIAAIPAGFRAKILIRIDGAGATERIQALNTTRRVVRFCVGWKITPVDEDAIAALPEGAWSAAVDQDGEPQHDCHVAEITSLNARTAGWPAGTRLIVRRSRPSRRHERKLTDFEKATGWRYQVTAIDYVRMRGVPGSHHPWFADVLYRQRGGAAEGRVRVNKAMGLTNLPSQTWDVNVGWVLAANLAADLDAWTRLLGLHDQPDVAVAEPATLRYRLWHLPARLVSHARRKILRIPADWPWTNAFTTCWNRLAALPHPG